MDIRIYRDFSRNIVIKRKEKYTLVKIKLGDNYEIITEDTTIQNFVPVCTAYAIIGVIDFENGSIH